MAKTATYSLIASYTHSGGSTTTITLSSIPATFTDLVVVSNVLYSANNGDYMSWRINGDSSALYSSTPISGDGTTASSTRATGDTKVAFYASSTSNYVPVITNFMDYANTATYKTFLNRSSNAASTVEARVGLYRSTAAISSISLFFAVASIAAGTNIKIYGIQAGSN
jgi:hypothetical protein